jgi:hypothetical protein
MSVGNAESCARGGCGGSFGFRMRTGQYRRCLANECQAQRRRDHSIGMGGLASPSGAESRVLSDS